MGNPIYPFQTTYQIIVRTVHKKPSFPRRREGNDGEYLYVGLSNPTKLLNYLKDSTYACYSFQTSYQTIFRTVYKI